MTDLRSVVAEPVVGLSEVIKDDTAPVTSTCRQDYRGRGVGFAGHPCRVEGVCNEEEGHDQNHPTGNLVGICNTGCHQVLLFWLGPSLLLFTELKQKHCLGGKKKQLLSNDSFNERERVHYRDFQAEMSQCKNRPVKVLLQQQHVCMKTAKRQKHVRIVLSNYSHCQEGEIKVPLCRFKVLRKKYFSVTDITHANVLSNLFSLFVIY